MRVLQFLKQLDVNRVTDFDDLVEALAVAKIVKAEFVANGFSAPEYVDNGIEALAKEISARREDAMKKRLSQLKGQRESLMTAQEKRRKVEDEIKSLESALTK